MPRFSRGWRAATPSDPWACPGATRSGPFAELPPGWDCDLEPDRPDRPALRLGLRLVRGMRRQDADAIVAHRGCGYRTPLELAVRAGLDAPVLERLARGDAFGSMGLSRRDAFWAIRGIAAGPASATLPLFAATGLHPVGREPDISLPATPLGEEVVDDYEALRLSLKAHPLALLRGHLAATGYQPCERLTTIEAGRRIRVCGLVLARQRPGTAQGVVFITLEDETGTANLVVWPDRFEQFRRSVIAARLLGVTGTVQREGLVVHLIVETLDDLTADLERLSDAAGPATGSTTRPLRVHPRNMRPSLRVTSRDFH